MVYPESGEITLYIHSELEQTSKALEAIVVDDGSQDNIRSVLKQLGEQDSRKRYLFHDSNKGAQGVRNTGIRASKGEWISFMDSDDYWYLHSFELRLKVAEQ